MQKGALHVHLFEALRAVFPQTRMSRSQIKGNLHPIIQARAFSGQR